MRKINCGMIIALLLVSVFPLAFNVQAAKAAGEAVCNRADGTAGRISVQSEVSAHALGTDDWPMFHHDLQHTGYSTSTAPNTNDTRWSYTTGDTVYSSPAVADGRVYVGSYDKKVYCLNATNGALIWNYTTGNWIYYSSPAVADGRVYVGSYDFKVYCLNATNGALIWNYTTGYWVASSPAVADSKVYIGSCDNKVYCLNALTGAYVWSYTTGNYVVSSPAFANGKIYVGSDDKKLYCLNATNGAYVWSYTTGDKVFSSPAVADDKVYVGSDDKKLYCLNATNGAFKWSYTTGDWVASSPAVADGKVYVGSFDKKLYCMSATNGALIWNYTTGNYVFSSPAVADGKVYVGSWDSKVYCLSATSGAFTWSYTTGNRIFSSPAVADDRVYVGSQDKKVCCFGLPATISLVVRGGDNRVWYRTYSGGVWGTWYPIAAATGDSLGAAMLGNNLHIVARDLSGTTIWHSYVDVTTNAFSGWTLISGVPVSAPTLTSNGAVLSLVVRGGDNRVWYRTYSGGVWGTWYPIAAATGDSLGAAMLGNNLHIVARNMAGTQIYHSYLDVTDDAFSGWTLISGQPVSKPTLTS